jgi:hypothetical protein
VKPPRAGAWLPGSGKRWAGARKPKAAATPARAQAARKKRRLNPAARARIIAAMKKRWAAQKKAASRELDATVLQTKGGPKRNLPISR